MWNESFMSTLTLMVMAALFWMGLGLRRPGKPENPPLPPGTGGLNNPPAALSPSHTDWSGEGGKTAGQGGVAGDEGDDERYDASGRGRGCLP